MYMQYKDNPQYGKNSKCHYYGHEQRITYNQCRSQRFPDIPLSKEMGYKSLVEMAEGSKYKRKYVSAKIYSKSDPLSTDFDILHREYLNGRLLTTSQNDPVFTDGNMILYKKDQNGIITTYERPANIILYYFVGETGRVEISNTPIT